MPMTSNSMTRKNEAPNATATAMSEYAMRQRSSSRWSRNGISALGVLPIRPVAAACPLAERAELLARELGLVGARVVLHQRLERLPRLARPTRLAHRKRVLVERRRRAAGLRVGAHDQRVGRI